MATQSTQKRKKKMTVAEKNYRATVKKDMQKNGLLPPDKKPLNRKRFAVEVLNVVNSDDFSFYDKLLYIIQGFNVMLPLYEDGKLFRPVTPEQVGVLKVLKIAMEIEAFWERKKAEGITEVQAGELFDEAIKPTLDL